MHPSFIYFFLNKEMVAIKLDYHKLCYIFFQMTLFVFFQASITSKCEIDVRHTFKLCYIFFQMTLFVFFQASITSKCDVHQSPHMISVGRILNS